MGFGEGGDGGGSDSKMLNFGMVQMHKRSKSFPYKERAEGDNSSVEASQRIKLQMGHSMKLFRTKQKQSSSNNNIQHSLNQEIIQLEKRLNDQFKVRYALEKALGYRKSSIYIPNEIPMPKAVTQLIKDITVLEFEVLHLEQYLLSLYRKAFDHQIQRLKSPLTTPRRRLDFSSQAIDRSDRSRSEFKDSWGRAICSCQSQPMTESENHQKGETLISLAEHLGTCILDHVPETPNKISEEMIKCMSAIYIKLSDPPSVSSPNSSISSTSDQCDTWSPGFRNNASFDVRLDNPFQGLGFKDFSGPYSTMIEVLCIYRDATKANEVEDLLQNFKSLISKLEEVDPRKLNHEEKLAFWINVHNALVMHAFLAYGIPLNSAKRVLLLLKAAYNVGGQTVSADAIQSSILGCRMSRPGQWLRLLFAVRKFKAGDERLGFAIHHSEPLLHFALSSGAHSDPAVRVYTPKRIYQELEMAKEEYIRATLGVRNQKIVLPKLVETFVKDSGICPADLMEMVHRSLPESSRKNLTKFHSIKSRKAVEWIPHSFSFRYLISRPN